MNLNSRSTRHENEYDTLMNIINFRLPHSFKKLGIISAVLIFGYLIVYKFTGGNNLLIKDICRTIMLLCLLVASLSKDRFEDEYISHVRAQSYALSFVFALLYSIGLPLISYVMDVLINKITLGDGPNFHEVSSFQVMFMLICFQLLFFEGLKKLTCAK